MARTTASLVAGIIEVDSSIDLTPFILAASMLVDDVASADSESVLNSDRLEMIERWLAAHYYAMRDPRAVSEKADVVGATYQSSVDLGLNSSHYGQMAQTFDSTGYLTAIAKGRQRKASVMWVGTESE